LVRLGQKLLDVLKACVARGTGAQVKLDFSHLSNFELPIEQRV
jgi:hypothetical protein